MGTEVLRPHDCLINRIRVPSTSPFRRKTYGKSCYYFNNNNNNFYVPGSGRAHRKPINRAKSRKQVAERKPSSDDSRVAKSTGMVMEKITILRRGESLNSLIKCEALKGEEDNSTVKGTQRLGPDPESVPKQIWVVDMKHGCNIYAGSACAVSPSPSALPFPSFFKKRPSPAVDDFATRDLRRLLRLE